MTTTPKRKRWLDNMVEAAKGETTAMPWQRGERRRRFIESREWLRPAA